MAIPSTSAIDERTVQRYLPPQPPRSSWWIVASTAFQQMAHAQLGRLTQCAPSLST